MAKKIVVLILGATLSVEIVNIMMGYIMASEYQLVHFLISLFSLLLALSVCVMARDFRSKILDLFLLANAVLVVLSLINLIFVQNYESYVPFLNFGVAGMTLVAYVLVSDKVFQNS